MMMMLIVVVVVVMMVLVVMIIRPKNYLTALNALDQEGVHGAPSAK